jgi:alpha-L-arabinofuranosidase
VTIDIRVGEPTGVDIAPDLWGIFLEDLNDALDGGLNAELVQNGDFQYSGADRPGWGPLTAWRVISASVERVAWAREEDPVHANNATHLRVAGPATLSNEGWSGIPVRGGRDQRLRLFARAVSGSGALRAGVTGRSSPLTSAAELVPTAEWSVLEADLSGLDDGRGALEIDVPDGSVVDIDLVSLRPLGDDRVPLLFREDLVQALAGLKPSFVRFPGGCLVHGRGVDSLYDWKSTIGPQESRRPMPNLWGYHQSMAIGYYEYFLLCEALGATPLPVVAAGVCCQNALGGQRAVAVADMPRYTQDVLDLVEFANGSPDTRWGAVRAELGHPAPFGMRYLGLGNEDEITPQFRDRYARIEDALREAHPELTVIGTVGPFAAGRDFERGWEFARSRGTDMVDEHFYRSPQWFHQNADRYAAYDPDGPGVYVGEYAARTSRLRSALAEAALMIGMESRSDVVRLASYAPLLARTGHTAWTPDLIYFSDDDVSLTASYHVQRMFSTERGERALAIDAELPVREVAEASSGSVTLIASGGSFEFADAAVDGSALEAVALAAGGRARIAGVDPRAAVIEFTVTRTDGERGIEVHVGEPDPGRALTLHLGGWQGTSTAVLLHSDGVTDDESDPTFWTGFRTGEPVRVRIETATPRVRVWVDGVLHHDYERDLRPERRVVVGASTRDGGHVVRVVNASGEARAVRIDLTASSAEALVLSGEPDQGAPDEAFPAPVAVPVAVGPSGLELTLAPWSFTVIATRT